MAEAVAQDSFVATKCHTCLLEQEDKVVRESSIAAGKRLHAMFLASIGMFNVDGFRAIDAIAESPYPQVRVCPRHRREHAWKRTWNVLASLTDVIAPSRYLGDVTIIPAKWLEGPQ